MNGRLRRGLVVCLLFSTITLFWFFLVVPRRGYLFVRKLRNYSAESNTKFTQRLTSFKVSNGSGWNSKEIPVTISSKYEAAEKTFSPKVSDRKKLREQRDHTKPVDAARRRECSLKWNTIGLNVESYETENSSVIEPPNTQRGRQTKIKQIFDNTTIRLDPEKFLLPVVTWGPNNQLIGFWEGVFVAVTLNRTVVLPRFRKHNFDRQWQRGKGNRISPIHRIDAESLCRFVSCATLDDFQNACNFKIDAILNIRYLKMKQVREIESNIRMRILPPDIDDVSQLTRKLVPTNGTSANNALLRYTADEVKSIFNTSERCVIHPFPFFDLLSHSRKETLYNRVSKTTLADENSRSDVRLLAKIMKNSQQAKYVRQIAKDFISRKLDGGPFISAHWRYNEGDYMAKWHCEAKEVNLRRCNKVRNYTASDFANRLDEEIEKLKAKNVIVETIYVAAPRSGNSMVAKVTQEVKGKEWKLSSSDVLQQFMKDSYADCDFVAKHFEDILSSTEMEICSRGVVFLGSLGTSWTGNVRKSRIFQEDHQTDASFDYIFRA